MSSTALKQSGTSLRENISKSLHLTNDELSHYVIFRHSALNDPGKNSFFHPNLGLLIVLVLVAHVLGLQSLLKLDTDSDISKKEKDEVSVEFFKPEVVPPPPVIQPPKPLPPPPKVRHETPPPVAAPQPAALRTEKAEDNIKADDLTVKENTEAPRSTGPVVAEPVAPPPPPKEEPITEAKGSIGYKNNPPPEFPAFAQRQGWEGHVTLRVRVLANGKPGDIQVKKSSGHKLLDDSAVEAVQSWEFAPSKRGDTPIDGWASVTIEFNQPR